MSAYPIGQLLTLPFLPLIRHIPIKLQVLIGIAFSSIVSFLFPLLYDVNPWLAVSMRFFHGISTAAAVPLLGHICSHWAPKSEIGLFVGTVTCFPQFALFFTQATSGAICEYAGWRWIFYVHGIVTLMVAALWALLFHDFPSDHPRLHLDELGKISHGKLGHATTAARSSNHEKLNVPYWQLITHKGVLAVLAAAFGTYHGILPSVNYAPLIMKKGLEMSEITISYFTSISVALQATLKILSGIISDKMTMTEASKLKMFNTISCGLPGMLLIITPFLPKGNKILCAIMMVICQAILGMPLFIGHGSIIFLSNLIFCWWTNGKAFVGK
ncbi:unnamed protein product, partial [Mesorhabditis spiculigera]